MLFGFDIFSILNIKWVLFSSYFINFCERGDHADCLYLQRGTVEYAHAALKARNRETKVTIFTSASGRLDFGFYRETFSRYKNSALLSLVAYVHQIA